MKIEVWAIGKCAHTYLNDGLSIYQKKLKHYISFEYIEWPESKAMRTADKNHSLQLQAEFVLSKLLVEDQLIIMEAKGKEFDSISFSDQLNKMMISGHKKYIFLIGGSFGFDQKIYSRANIKISLSRLTFSHDMVRLILLEQLYRGFTILRHEPYHHE